MRVVIIGGRGYIGGKLSEFLSSQGHEVVISSRRPSSNSLTWDGQDDGQLASQLAGVDAIVNLAGAPIADKPWSAARKRVLYTSRVETTAAVVKAANKAGVPVLINASAVGIYGDTGEDIVDEQQAAGEGYLASLCVDWEGATRDFKSRCVNLRIGVVLGPGGGMLAKLIPLFRLGLGGPLGAGNNWMPWIHIDDLVRSVGWCLDKPVQGPVNAVAPEAVTNLELSRSLASALGRPCWLAVPVVVLRIVFGKALVDEALVCSQRVRPRMLEESGFTWTKATVGEALREVVAQIT